MSNVCQHLSLYQIQIVWTTLPLLFAVSECKYASLESLLVINCDNMYRVKDAQNIPLRTNGRISGCEHDHHSNHWRFLTKICFKTYKEI